MPGDRPVFQTLAENNIRRLQAATVATYLVAFALLAVTIAYGLGKVRHAHGHLEDVMARHERKEHLITDTQFAALRRADSVQSMILETDPFRLDEVYMASQRYGFQVGDGRNKIRALLTSDQEKALLAEQDALIAEAVVLHDEIADLTRDGQHAAARELFATRVASLHERGNATFQGLRDLQTRAAEQSIGAANQEYKAAFQNAVTAMLASLLVSTGIGLVMYRASSRISERLRRNVGNLHRMALYDGLTGLHNRTSLTQLIDRQLRAAEPFALLYMDLDGFKQVNDDYGHTVGDELLKIAASRIRGRMRGIDAVARIGGDEFVALMHGIGQVAECEHAARHIIEAFAEPFAYQGIEAEIGISIGIALAPDGGRDAAQILSAADHTMYRAKKRGSNRYEVHPGAFAAPATDCAVG